eukprot:TRINITY_DN9831_c0_g1_i1.p1 TRINITY_DN9831_c0_g1~~TRINITY_DN9831_c0_g1_i1.p1  ORF type:complete len:1007 (-),score=223.26 TRINITY_DN9831_c0_g1_i1:67-2865(-)
MNEIGNNIGLEIWKLVDIDTIEKVAKNLNGNFQTDKAYIVLKTLMKEGSMSDRDYLHNVHTWLGALAKDDQKYCNSAHAKAAELELILEGKTVVIYSEMQNHESPMFLSYFKGAIQYVDPVKLKKVDHAAIAQEKARPKLFQLKGRRQIRAKQVDPTVKSLNKGDVFILDCGDVIYQWNGSEAARMKKGKGLDLTVRLRDERGAKARVVILEEKGEDEPDFWTALGGRGTIAEAEPPEADLEFEKAANVLKLYRVNDCLGELEVEQVEADGQNLHVNMLDPIDCFILDCETEIFVWVGIESSEIEKSGAMSNAREFLTNYNRPPWTPIIKVSQGAEPALFKDKFKRGDWNEYVENYEYRKRDNVAGSIEQSKVNVDEMHHPEKYAIAKEELVQVIPHAGEENGILKMWYIEDFKKHELPEEEYGIFFTSQCYIVSYRVKLLGGEESQIVYFWQGWTAGQDDKGTSALLAKEVSAEMGRNCVQVRVVQNKEPDHFLSHYEGKMIVRKGKRSDGDVDPSSFSGLFHIRGTGPVTTRAIQVDLVIKSFNTNDVFLMITPKLKCAWYGKNSLPCEREFSGVAGEILLGARASEIVEIEEGNEPSAFWDALGGKGTIVSMPYTKKSVINPRLFQCSNATGAFKVVEIPNFTQDDLDNEDVMILDAVQEVFVWIGANSTDIEKNMSMSTAIEYLKNAPENRSDQPTYVVNVGHEPPNFTCHFHAWDRQKAKDLAKTDESGESVAYLRKLAVLQQEEPKLFRMNSQFVLPKFLPTDLPPEPTTIAPRGGPLKKDASQKTGIFSRLGNAISGKGKRETPKKEAPSSPVSSNHPPAAAAVKESPPAGKALPSGFVIKTRQQSGKAINTLVEDAESAAFALTPIYNMTRLKSRPLPDDVIHEQMEKHLCTEEFHEVFKMTRKQWEAVPRWKKITLKKDVGLF